jgi:hypothetical protein
MPYYATDRDQARGWKAEAERATRAQRVAEAQATVFTIDGEYEAAEACRIAARMHGETAQAYLDALRAYSAGGRR